MKGMIRLAKAVLKATKGAIRRKYRKLDEGAAALAAKVESKEKAKQ